MRIYVNGFLFRIGFDCGLWYCWLNVTYFEPDRFDWIVLFVTQNCEEMLKFQCIVAGYGHVITFCFCQCRASAVLCWKAGSGIDSGCATECWICHWKIY